MVGGVVARQVHLELSVTIAAVLEAKGLELMVAGGELQSVHQDVAPNVTGGVLSAVDSNERSSAIVGMHPEVVGAAEEVHLESVLQQDPHRVFSCVLSVSWRLTTCGSYEKWLVHT
eukprot:COSAG06_NODE_4838_length_3918_cov_1.587850_4_plen_116_part_00